MIGAWWAKLQRSVWPAAVVVGGVAGKEGPQMSFAEDQDAVGELGSGGEDEAFGEAVCSRTSRWDLHGIYAGAGQDASRLGVNPRRVTGMAGATPAGAWKIMAADLIFRGK